MRDELKFRPIPKDIGDYVAYSEESSTGLINKVDRTHHSKKGQEIGFENQGYYRFKFGQKLYSNHRIIYFLNTGIDPEEKTVDHEDGDSLNNKISNLRLATRSQNQDNRKKQKNNKSGATGVFFRKSMQTWEPYIVKGVRQLSLGRFKNKDKAVAVRIVAEADPRFRDQEFRNPHNDEHAPSPEMLVWAKQYLEDRIERLGWVDKYNL